MSEEMWRQFAKRDRRVPYSGGRKDRPVTDGSGKGLWPAVAAGMVAAALVYLLWVLR